MKNYVCRLVSASLFLCLSACWAIDNPDAPNYVADFELKNKAFEERINDEDGGAQAVAKAYAEYEAFLDSELNSAYKLLKGHLEKNEAEALKHAQKNWLKYRRL